MNDVSGLQVFTDSGRAGMTRLKRFGGQAVSLLCHSLVIVSGIRAFTDSGQAGMTGTFAFVMPVSVSQEYRHLGFRTWPG